ncbi:1,2-dihydroxy-3-keto-5-methylthiopentene dioxygenase [Pichia californica]|uniref:Acireductone dioxygenase n=1 Tax=Pichia californica TaxID=460514 RepID=A0A9P7BFG9_9ASCO|nr:1,2-dihydroxy-3-keto-5-methylthiopentene dioxygenase [[Candida] californica]KAG0687649.1 1,2-dihydroxy-3-keto-5-methylthiopentene dioxygenase [[Candida] californica]
MVRAYYYKEDDEPMTNLHDSGENVSIQELENIGIFYKSINSLENVDKIAIDRNYKNRDYITLDSKTFPGGEESLNNKLNIFFTEHLHEDEEIRYIIDGNGFFDVRNNNDKWIRILVEKNDLLILPAGIYHRFTLTNNKFVKALRLFKDEPKWIALNRIDGNTESNKYRKEYISSIIQG